MQNLRRITLIICCALLAIQQDSRAEIVTVSTWNTEWFPGHKSASTLFSRETLT